MSQRGQKRILKRLNPMSALPSIADILQRGVHTSGIKPARFDHSVAVSKASPDVGRTQAAILVLNQYRSIGCSPGKCPDTRTTATGVQTTTVAITCTTVAHALLFSGLSGGENVGSSALLAPSVPILNDKNTAKSGGTTANDHLLFMAHLSLGFFGWGPQPLGEDHERIRTDRSSGGVIGSRDYIRHSSKRPGRRVSTRHEKP